MAITLDGFIGDLNDKWDWMVRDDTVDNESLGELLRTTDTILLGRDTYQVFVSYWPNAVAWNPALPEGQKQFASWIVDVPKIVFSTTLDRADWNNTTLVKTDVAGKSTGSSSSRAEYRGRGRPQACPIAAAAWLD